MIISIVTITIVVAVIKGVIIYSKPVSIIISIRYIHVNNERFNVSISTIAPTRSREL